MPHRLNEQKNRVEQQRHYDKKDCLLGGKCGATGRSSEVWQDQAKHCQRHDDINIGVDPLEVVMLLAIKQSTQQQAQANKAVQSDHHDTKNCVSPEFRIICSMQHRRGYHDYLDADCRKRQDQSPIRFA